MINLYEKLSNINRAIVDTQYPISFDGIVKCYYGISNEGCLRLSFLSTMPLNINGVTKSINIVEGYSSTNNYWTCFDLKNDDLLPVFSTFGEDLISCIIGENRETVAANNLRIRYKTWLALFKKPRSVLSPEKTQGLFGELYFLKNTLFSKYGVEKSILAWSGPDKTSKDFSIDSDWYEVKTIGNSTPVVKISSLQQLSSNYDGNLAVLRVEAMSEAYNNVDCCINNLIQSIITCIDDSDLKDNFLDKVSNYGYDFCDEAGDKKFQISSLTKYLVDSNFPVLKEEDIKSNAINNVSYELVLSLIKSFIIKE